MKFLFKGQNTKAQAETEERDQLDFLLNEFKTVSPSLALESANKIIALFQSNPEYTPRIKEVIVFFTKKANKMLGDRRVQATEAITNLCQNLLIPEAEKAEVLEFFVDRINRDSHRDVRTSAMFGLGSTIEHSNLPRSEETLTLFVTALNDRYVPIQRAAIIGVNKFLNNHNVSSDKIDDLLNELIAKTEGSAEIGNYAIEALVKLAKKDGLSNSRSERIVNPLVTALEISQSKYLSIIGLIELAKKDKLGSSHDRVIEILRERTSTGKLFENIAISKEEVDGLKSSIDSFNTRIEALDKKLIQVQEEAEKLVLERRMEFEQRMERYTSSNKPMTHDQSVLEARDKYLKHLSEYWSEDPLKAKQQKPYICSVDGASNLDTKNIGSETSFTDQITKERKKSIDSSSLPSFS